MRSTDATGSTVNVVVLIGRRTEPSLAALAERLRDRSASVELLPPGPDTRQHLLRMPPNCLVVDFRAGDAAIDLTSWYCTEVSRRVLTITDHKDVLGRLGAIAVGVADHMVAPFALGEGIARIESLLAGRSTRRGLLQVADITLDPARRIAIRGGTTAIPLTPREHDVLALLMRDRGRVISKQELIEEVWIGKQPSPNAVEATISSLRRKLHRPGDEIIRTVHGAGYTLRVPMTSTPSRGAMMAERDRLVQERDDAIARRDKVIRRLRDEIDVAAGETRQLRRNRAADHRDEDDA